eukprot:23836_1
MDHKAVQAFVDNDWETVALPALEKFIEIPNTSPEFGGDGADALCAARFLESYVASQTIAGLRTELLTAEGRTPMLVVTVDGTDGSDHTVLSYGHMDKQPGLGGWSIGGPTTPVIKDGKLYGRGGCDDGYALLSYLSALKSLKAQNVKHCRMVITIEAGEESGSPDMEYWLDHLAPHIGSRVSLLFCLDSGAGDYDHLWITPSLRGFVAGTLKVAMLSEQVHSGEGSGVVADSGRVIRMLLNRVEAVDSGRILVPECSCEIPPAQREYVENAAKVLGSQIVTDLPLLDGVQCVSKSVEQLLINQIWTPQMTIIATDTDTLPPLPGSNIIRTQTALRLSVRLPPKVDVEIALKAFGDTLLRAPLPYGAHVTFDDTMAGPGWASTAEKGGWLSSSIEKASRSFFGRQAQYKGEGGSIPIICDFQKRYPEAEIIVTGTGGPQSNSHAVNESLDIPCVKKMTACVASILSDHAKHVATSRS